MSYCVYKHTNKKNGMSYIGMTKLPPERRWNSGRGYKCSTKFNNAIEQFGWDMFSHEVLADGLTKIEASNLEERCIKEYDTINNGYNIKDGGIHGGVKGWHHSEKTKAKIGAFSRRTAEIKRERAKYGKGKPSKLNKNIVS